MGRVKWDSFTVHLIELLFDFFVIAASYTVIMYFYFNQRMDLFFETQNNLVFFAVTLSSLLIVNFFMYRVYRVSVINERLSKTYHKLFIGLLISSSVVYLTTFLYFNYTLPKQVIWFALFLQLVALFFSKYLFSKILLKYHVKHGMIFGPKEEVKKLLSKMLQDGNPYLKIKYLVYDDDTFDWSQIEDIILQVDYIYSSSNISNLYKTQLSKFCLSHHKIYYIVPSIFELMINRSRYETISDILTFKIKPLGLSLEQRFLKRLMDVILAIVILLASMPIMILISVLIKAQDRGPVLFSQQRVTKNQKHFRLYKFRTMIPNAEQKTGPIQSTTNDPRITKFGNFLRRSRLDELPQLFNVLKGDLSLVGPRALRFEEVNEFSELDENFKLRFSVKAGVTGLAQTRGYYHTEFKDKLVLDVMYICKYNIFYDIVILILTVRTVLDRRSAEGVASNKDLKNYFLQGSQIKQINSFADEIIY